MRFVHLADLHLGKRVNEFSMIDDQKYILTEILNIIDEEKPNGILIAGDVYDKSVPSEDAVKLLDEFITKLAKRKLEVFMISGNHDSNVKLSFASGLLNASGIHIAPVYDGTVEPFVFEKEKVAVYSLPFIRPVNIRSIFEDEKDNIHTYTDAVDCAIRHMELRDDCFNILVAHQFVTGASRSDSEEASVGGIDNVDSWVFDGFDYVALGHIHGPQKAGRDAVRYSGTPLKYSFSEVDQEKSVTVLDIDADHKLTIRTRKLTPKRDMREISGTYMELSSKANYEGKNKEDYIHAVLLDEDDVPEAMAKLRIIYPNIMKLTYDNKRTRENRSLENIKDIESRSPLDLFEEFYETQNNCPMSDTQRDFVSDLIKKIWEEEEQ